jgi:hypothetical protein
LFLTACTHQKRIGTEELASEIRAGRSVAAESELFVDFFIQGHSTHHYAEQHSAYLEDLVQQSAKKLEETVPEREIETSFRECQAKLNLLAAQILRVHLAIAAHDDEALLAAKDAIHRIRMSLEQRNSSP